MPAHALRTHTHTHMKYARIANTHRHMAETQCVYSERPPLRAPPSTSTPLYNASGFTAGHTVYACARVWLCLTKADELVCCASL